MKVEPEVKEKVLTVEIGEYKTEMTLCDKTLTECEDIKAEAKALLDEIKNTGDGEQAADKRVQKFLKDSIGRLLGKDAVSEIFCRRLAEIPQLTAVLCYLISQIGLTLEDAAYEE